MNIVKHIDETIDDLRTCLQDNRRDASLVAMYSQDIADQRAIRAGILFTAKIGKAEK